MLLLLLQYSFYLIQTQAHYNPIPSISILPRFHDPCIILINITTELGLLHFLDLLANGVVVV